MAYMQRITSAAASRPAVRQALQKASNSCSNISSVPKRNYWGHRYHVVPVDGKHRVLSSLIKELINQIITKPFI